MLICNPGGSINFYNGYWNVPFLWNSLFNGYLVTDFIEIRPRGYVTFYSIDRSTIHRNWSVK